MTEPTLGDLAKELDRISNGRALRRAFGRDLRTGFISAVAFVALLFAIMYGLRALGVGDAARSRSAASAANIDSLRANQDTLKTLLRQLLERREP